MKIQLTCGKITAISFLFFLLFSCASISSAPARNSTNRKNGIYHIVRKRQTLWRIAKVYNVDIKLLMKVNGIKNPSDIKIGQKLFIPGAKKVKYVPPYDKIIGITKGRKPSGGKPLFIWPVKGIITKVFGTIRGKQHNGIDIAAPSGTPIKAAASGTVVYSDNRLRGYGNMIIISHSKKFTTVYAHNKRNLVKKGERVKKGEIIGYVGKTGAASGPHLHFEIRFRGNAVNPINYLPKK